MRQVKLVFETIQKVERIASKSIYILVYILVWC